MYPYKIYNTMNRTIKFVIFTKGSFNNIRGSEPQMCEFGEFIITHNYITQKKKSLVVYNSISMCIPT